MSIENTPDSTTENGSFEVDENAFYGQKDTPDDTQEEQASTSEEDEDDQTAADATETDEDTNEVDTDDEDEDEQEPAPEPEPKKSRTQKRFDELTAKAHEAERRANALEAKLNEAIAKLDNKSKEDTPPASKAAAPSSTPPKADDLNEDGTDKYPLGEFDPQFNVDLTRHTIAEESRAIKERDEAERTANDLAKQERELITNWSAKLEEAEVRYPNIKETNNLLEDTFRGLDPNYGKYLAATIMSMEFGPDVLDYLGNNLDEAKRIVNSGATKAVMALGALETKYRTAEAEKVVAKPRVSKAPTPPPTNKGSTASMASVPLDTDDLDAFAAQFDQKKRKA